FFFFQAEDGIRDFHVTGVQTCALPIFMPFWKNELGRPDDNLIDLATNLRYGCTILKYYLDLEKGDLRRALARYNGSLGSHRYPDKVQEYWYRYWYVRD